MRKFLKNILVWINVALAASLLIAYLAVIINPAKIVLPALFGLAYPYLLLLNIIFMLAWGIKLKKEALISAIVILLGITHFNNFIQFGKGKSGEADFSVTSYNVKVFNRWEEASKSEVQVIALLEQDIPDIICLQEFHPSYGISNVEYTFVDALDPDYYFHFKALDKSLNKSSGILTISKYPIINRGDIVHPKSGSLTIFSDITIGNDTVRVYNNHLQSFRLRRMEHSFLEEISGGSESQGVDEILGLSKALKTGFSQRATQALAVQKHIVSSPHPVIVCGDFNDTPVSFSYRKIRKGLDDAFVEAGRGAGFTYKDKYPPNRIDYILYSEEFSCEEFRINKVNYSDHYPVRAYFKTRD